MGPPAFLDLAACKGADLDLFFPMGDSPGAYSQARQYCARCPVVSECLQYALDLGSDYGMYGGTTPADRRHIRAGETLAASFGVGHGDKPGTSTGYYREKAAGLTPCDDCRNAYNRRARDRRAASKVAV